MIQEKTNLDTQLKSQIDQLDKQKELETSKLSDIQSQQTQINELLTNSALQNGTIKDLNEKISTMKNNVDSKIAEKISLSKMMSIFL